jgi:hypothetical protein
MRSDPDPEAASLPPRLHRLLALVRRHRADEEEQCGMCCQPVGWRMRCCTFRICDLCLQKWQRVRHGREMGTDIVHVTWPHCPCCRRVVTNNPPALIPIDPSRPPTNPPRPVFTPGLYTPVLPPAYVPPEDYWYFLADAIGADAIPGSESD